MRPVPGIAAVVLVAAVAITGCAAHPAVQPAPPVVDQAPMPVTDTLTVSGGAVQRVQERVAINACRAVLGASAPSRWEPGDVPPTSANGFPS